MRRLFASMGHVVTEARSAAEALARFDGHDIAVIDLVLPDQPGYTLVPEIRRRGLSTRVALWTGSKDPQLLAKAAAAVGADAVFHKANDLEKLLAWIGGASRARDEGGR